VTYDASTGAAVVGEKAWLGTKRHWQVEHWGVKKSSLYIALAMIELLLPEGIS